MFHRGRGFGPRETPQQYQARHQRVAMERAQRDAEKAQRQQVKNILHAAYTARTKGDYQNAVNLYTNVLRMKPSHKGAYLYRGQCYGHLSNNMMAYRDYKQAFSINDPMFKQEGALYGCLYTICIRLGENFCNKGNPEHAVPYFEESINYTQKTDQKAASYFNCGNAYLKLKNYTSALPQLMNAVALDKEQANYAMALSFCYKNLIQSSYETYHRQYRAFLHDAQQALEVNDWCEDDLRWLGLFKAAKEQAYLSHDFIARSSLLNIRETVAHIDSGEVSFKNIVLNWRLEDINRIDQLNPIRDRYQDGAAYYEAMIPLILEETKASMRQYIEEPKETKETFQLGIYRVQSSKNAQNPNKIIVSRNSRIPKEYLEMSQSCIALWLDCKLSNGHRVEGLGLASIVDNETQIKTMIPADELRSVNKMEASFWGSLVTFERMYAVCFEKPFSAMVERISSARLRPWVSSNSVYSHKVVFGLDPSQRRAISNFLASPDMNLYLLQGPPGTGKTTTIVALLQLCIDQQLRVLVTAPSNKAIQELAIRLLQKAPEIKMMLAGVEEKTPDSLLPIFVHGWHKYYLEKIVNVMNQFAEQDLLTSLIVLTPEQIKENRQELIAEFDRLNRQVVKFYRKLETVLNNLGVILYGLIEVLLSLSAEDLTSWYDYLNSEELLSTPSLFEYYANKTKEIEPLIKELRMQLFDSEANELRLLDQSQIIFASLSVCGRQSLRRLQQGFDIVITDEAGQADPGALLIPAWFPTFKALYVGDPMQLPATTLSQTADQTRFAESTLARLIRLEAPYDMLDNQYRMHPEIRQFPSNQFYRGRLLDGININIRENPLESLYEMPFFPYGVVDIASGVESTAGKSRYNEKEIKAVEQLIKKINTKKSDAQIGVIAFYRAQVERLQNRLKKYKNVIVATVDGFQGGERDCIIISCVRANVRGNVGFARDFRRANVAITRARHGLVIFGNATTLTQEEHVLKDLIQDAQSRNKVVSEDDFYQEVGKPVDETKGKTKKSDLSQRSDKKGKSKKQETIEKNNDNICWAFFKTGKCKFGDKCKYDHVRKDNGYDGRNDRLSM